MSQFAKSKPTKNTVAHLETESATMKSSMGAPHYLHSLQQTIGNQAVTQLLQTQGRTSQQRKQKVIQRQVAAAIHPSQADDTRIGDIAIIGRTPNLPGFGGMGSHITMWAIITDMVKSRLRNATYGEAIGIISIMEEETKRLPGYGQYVNMTHEQQLHQYDAELELHQAYTTADAANTGNSPALPLRVQEYIVAFLNWRNTIPLTTFDFGPATATPGQQTGLGILRSYESGQANFTRQELRNAMMATLDYATMENAALIDNEDDARPSAPGIDSEDQFEIKMAMMIEQHLLVVEKAYPNCAARASIGEEYLTAWLDGQDCGETDAIIDALFDLYGRD